MAKLLIIGASRGIGRETVKAALAAGHSVRALARSAWSIPIQNPGLDKVPGNALDSSAIRSALAWTWSSKRSVLISRLGLSSSAQRCFRNQPAS
jgi:NAD(P)-dependent dehydrogenase (short-subunit alcohol dehydrogenase family)